MSENPFEDIDKFLANIGQMKSSDMGIKISKHIFECKLCQMLSGLIGISIEAHMKEKEDLGKLV